MVVVLVDNLRSAWVLDNASGVGMLLEVAAGEVQEN